MTRIQKQVKIHYKPNPLDHEEFEALCDVLYEAFKGNKAQLCRALDISKPTWNKWMDSPPTWPYWNLVLRKIILDVATGIEARRGTAARLHKQHLISALSRIPKSDPIHEEIDRMGYYQAAARDHLRSLLSRHGKYKDEIFTNANMGGFSRKAIERAASAIGVVKDQEGFGDNKRSYWRLPTADD